MIDFLINYGGIGPSLSDMQNQSSVKTVFIVFAIWIFAGAWRDAVLKWREK